MGVAVFTIMSNENLPDTTQAQIMFTDEVLFTLTQQTKINNHDPGETNIVKTCVFSLQPINTGVSLNRQKRTDLPLSFRVDIFVGVFYIDDFYFSSWDVFILPVLLLSPTRSPWISLSGPFTRAHWMSEIGYLFYFVSIFVSYHEGHWDLLCILKGHWLLLFTECGD